MDQFLLEIDESTLVSSNNNDNPRLDTRILIDEILDLQESDTDFSDDENDISLLKLYLGQTFQTWDDAEKFLNDYGLEKGFSIRRKRTDASVEGDNKILRRISWECSCAGKYQAKKILNPVNQ